ncbi:MAG: hypothetical protein MUE99_07570 [Chitinophagaceae bacterium]|jgi:hypothetical protein|nr:hypothetical protein [Chitinophagaceae bacterium]
MKAYIKTSISLLVLTLIISAGVLFSGNVYGQDGGNDPDQPGVPLDGGLSILLAAGAAYGGKKFYDANKKNKKD